jgi:hypothetical protein
MSSWVNRTLLSGTSTAANGGTSHTCTFTAATSGNFLMAVMSASVTFTTPTGWTLLGSAINNGVTYVFTRTATAGLSSFATTHNASNYAIEGVVYEFASGSAATGTAGSNTSVSSSGSVSGTACTSLSGTYTRFGAFDWNIQATSGTASFAWTTPTVEDQDQLTLHSSQDGIEQTIAYDDGASGASFTPSGTVSGTALNLTGESLSWAATIVTAGAATIPDITMAPMIGS